MVIRVQGRVGNLLLLSLLLGSLGCHARNLTPTALTTWSAAAPTPTPTGLPASVPLVSSLAPTANDLQQRVQVQLQQAQSLYRQSRLEEAEQSWKQVLGLDPQNQSALAGLQKLQTEIYLARSDAPFDATVGTLFREGLRELRQERWAEAELKLNEALRLNPEQDQVKAFLAVARSSRQQADRAANLKQIKSQALAAEQGSDWSRSLKHWREALKLAPADAEAASGTARALAQLAPWIEAQLTKGEKAMAQHQWSQAEAVFAEVLAVSPDTTQAQAGLAACQKARSAAAQHVQARATSSQWFDQGALCYREGDLGGAVSAWTAACAANPKDTESQEWLARAQKELAQAAVRDRKRAEARYADGLAAYQRGELDAAVAAWKEALVLDPAHEKARANLTRVQAELK